MPLRGVKRKGVAMSDSVEEFFKHKKWFRYGPERKELLVVFYMLYRRSCELEGESPLPAETFIDELSNLGLTRVGQHVQGVKLTESGERIGVAEVILAQHQQEKHAQEDDLLI